MVEPVVVEAGAGGLARARVVRRARRGGDLPAGRPPHPLAAPRRGPRPLPLGARGLRAGQGHPRRRAAHLPVVRRPRDGPPGADARLRALPSLAARESAARARRRRRRRAGAGGRRGHARGLAARVRRALSRERRRDARDGPRGRQPLGDALHLRGGAAHLPGRRRRPRGRRHRARAHDLHRQGGRHDAQAARRRAAAAHRRDRPRLRRHHAPAASSTIACSTAG